MSSLQKKLLIALLILIPMLWFSLRAGKEARMQTTVIEPFDCSIECMACAAIWDTNLAEASGALFNGEVPDAYRAVACKTCGKNEAWLQETCPHCKKGFVADYQKDHGENLGHEVLCPHCEKNILAL